MIKKIKILFWGNVLLAVAILIIPAIIYALNTIDTGFRSDPGTTIEIDAHGVCRQVINNSSNSYFVPTKAAGEWFAFRTNPPPEITLASCYSYSWQTGGWSGCSVSCGSGTRTRSVWCQRSDGVQVDDSYCGGGKPATSDGCNQGACASGSGTDVFLYYYKDKYREANSIWDK